MISLEMYRKVLRPFHQRYIDLAKAYNKPVMVHTCGSSSWVYEDFIEMGVNAVDTLQPEAANMDPRYLKEHFGGRLSFCSLCIRRLIIMEDINKKNQIMKMESGAMIFYNIIAPDCYLRRVALI